MTPLLTLTQPFFGSHSLPLWQCCNIVQLLLRKLFASEISIAKTASVTGSFEELINTYVKVAMGGVALPIKKQIPLASQT